MTQTECKDELKQIYSDIYQLTARTQDILENNVPNYNPHDHRLNHTKECTASPVGLCVCRLVYNEGYMEPDECIFCGRRTR